MQYFEQLERTVIEERKLAWPDTEDASSKGLKDSDLLNLET